MTAHPTAAAGDRIEIDVLPRIADIAAADWDACACPEQADGRPLDPFTTHRFLRALEASQSVGRGTGWEPHHLVARHRGEIVAVAPLYARGPSQGESIFDQNFTLSAGPTSGARLLQWQFCVEDHVPDYVTYFCFNGFGLFAVNGCDGWHNVCLLV